ncbi:hypothetical protein [Verminephrobacter aporrectodeae]|nr:hypothetical protein [Verminephrobacter aporrectodeae]
MIEKHIDNIEEKFLADSARADMIHDTCMCVALAAGLAALIVGFALM